ncbi:hypothetical protein [Kribbella amoyensis]|nr:hypothetical protein [Kribbella amoyensis]
MSSIRARSLLVLAAALIGLLAATIPAATANAAVTASDPEGAAGCTAAHGPGNWNNHCVRVNGAGLNVESIEGWIDSKGVPGYPVTVCNVKIEVWGTELGGYPYSNSFQHNTCALGHLGAKFTVNKQFQPGSQVCSKAIWEGKQPQPACVQIRY